MSMILGVLTVLLWYSIALDVTHSRLIAYLVAIGFACSNSFLTYIHAGTSYVPGLLCMTLALWLIRGRQRQGVLSAGLITASASATVLATLLWFPYVLSVPGILFAGIWLSDRPLSLAALMKPETRRFVLRFVAVFLLWLFVGFGIGAWAGGIHSSYRSARLGEQGGTRLVASGPSETLGDRYSQIVHSSR
jgi:dolichyl-phosphate-mannose--protein O-mannosyl transferase